MTKYKYKIYQEELNIAFVIKVDNELSQDEINAMGNALINGSEWFIDCGEVEGYEWQCEILPYEPDEKSWLDHLEHGETIPLYPEDHYMNKEQIKAAHEAIRTTKRD